MKLTKEQKFEMFQTLLESSRTGEKVNVKKQGDTLHVTDKADPLYLHNAHEIMDMALIENAAKSLGKNISKVLMGLDPDRLDYAGGNSLSHKMVGNSNMFLLQISLWNGCTLNRTQVVTEDKRWFRHRHTKTAKHVAKRNCFLDSRTQSNKFSTVG
jgi:hypothetical protein